MVRRALNPALLKPALGKKEPPLQVVPVPPAEFESATFCSASKRSIQLRYEGINLRVLSTRTLNISG
jgi:hypothetical protein